jgi:hypothetical protein
MVLYGYVVKARLRGLRVLAEPPDVGGTGSEEHRELQRVHGASRLIVHATVSRARKLNFY